VLVLVLKVLSWSRSWSWCYLLPLAKDYIESITVSVPSLTTDSSEALYTSLAVTVAGGPRTHCTRPPGFQARVDKPA